MVGSSGHPGRGGRENEKWGICRCVVRCCVLLRSLAAPLSRCFAVLAVSPSGWLAGSLAGLARTRGPRARFWSSFCAAAAVRLWDAQAERRAREHTRGSSTAWTHHSSIHHSSIHHSLFIHQIHSSIAPLLAACHLLFAIQFAIQLPYNLPYGLLPYGLVRFRVNGRRKANGQRPTGERERERTLSARSPTPTAPTTAPTTVSIAGLVL